MYRTRFTNNSVMNILQTRLRIWSVNYDKFNTKTKTDFAIKKSHWKPSQ